MNFRTTKLICFAALACLMQSPLSSAQAASKTEGSGQGDSGTTGSVTSASSSSSGAGSSGPESKSSSGQDEMARALADELLRSRTRLKVKTNPPPYFLSYLVRQVDWFRIIGAVGGIDHIDDDVSRVLDADVRVGDYKFDSTGGEGDIRSMLRSLTGAGLLPLDDNYDAIRHELWLRTDTAYKRAIEALETKKAAQQQRRIEDVPDSMSRVNPVTKIMDAGRITADKEEWKNTVREVSAVFRSYKQVIDSNISFTNRARTRWFVNSEGSSNREGEEAVVVTFSATAESSDGMRVTDSVMRGGNKLSDLPGKEELKMIARQLAERVTAVANAPVVEDYRGPVLFEKAASAELFAQGLAPQLVSRPQTTMRLMGAASAEPIGKRILPTFIQVADDPLLTDFNGRPLKGGWEVDDEGVLARRVSLVENGILKTLCSGRSPGRQVKESNGHWRDGSALPSRLFVTSSKPMPMSAMRQKLLEMGKEEGLKYVYVVRNISSTYTATFGGSAGISSMFGARPFVPTLLYRISVDDGKEELVRGARFANMSQRFWRDIQHAGDDLDVYTVYYPIGPNSTSSSIVVPSILVSELDIERLSRVTNTPMVLPNPFFDKSLNGSFSGKEGSSDTTDRMLYPPG